jgi:hypothetical protein
MGRKICGINLYQFVTLGSVDVDSLEYISGQLQSELMQHMKNTEVVRRKRYVAFKYRITSVVMGASHLLDQNTPHQIITDNTR